MASADRQRRARTHRAPHAAVATPSSSSPASRRPASRRPHDLALSQDCSGQASAAAAFFARAAQKLNLSSGQGTRPPPGAEARYAGFCGALHRLQPPLPPALQRRLGAGAKDFTGAGKVRVLLRVSGPGESQASGIAVDQRKKQVTLTADTSSSSPSGRPAAATSVVAVPKMFAFDAVFTDDDSQADVCSNSLIEALHAVINGTDGCLFSFGTPRLDTARTMVGRPGSAATLGAVPSAIAWLFRAVAERKQWTGARFSVRVSAVEVCGASNHACDLLKGYASDGEQPPGVYLREDPLFGTPLQHHSELRAPSAEKAAFYLDAAVAARTSPTSHLVFTLHVYQYSLAGLRGVAGGRSRLHLIDVGDCHRSRSGKELTISALGSVLLAIFSGHKHLPYREHKITQILKDCFSSLMCHTTVIAHVSPLMCHYTDTLATLQLAARMHRIRHRKIKFFGPTVGCSFKKPDNDQPTDGSDVDPSSSEQSADTVIYVGQTDDATDGEHPPIYTPSLGAKDTRSVKHQENVGNEVVGNKETTEIKEATCASQKLPAVKSTNCRNSPTRSNKSSFSRSASLRDSSLMSGDALVIPGKSSSDEQWVDGPRVPKSRVAEALSVKEGDHKKETWVDGPLHRGHGSGYGFMDEHKKLMIRSWVENQTSSMHKKGETGSRSDPPPHKAAEEEPSQHVVTSTDLVPVGGAIPVHPTPSTHDTVGCSVQMKDAGVSAQDIKPGNSETNMESNSQQASREISIDVLTDYFDVRLRIPVTDASSRDGPLKTCAEPNTEDEENKYLSENYDSEYEIIEVDETTEAISMQDSCLQVTEEEIAMCMEEEDRLLENVNRENSEHPLHILSQENLTTISTFTDSSASVHGGQQSLQPRLQYDSSDRPTNQPFVSNADDFYKTHHFQDASNTDNYVSRRQCFRPSVATSDIHKKKQHTGARIFHYHFPTRRLHNLSILHDDLMKYDSIHSPVGVQSAYSEPVPHQIGSFTGSNLCENCKRNFKYFGSSIEVDHQQDFSNEEFSSRDTPKGLPRVADLLGGEKVLSDVGDGRFSILSLRHPDGASNPNLSEEAVRGKGRKDDEELSPDCRPESGRVGSYDSGHESGSPQLKKQQQKQEHEQQHHRQAEPRTGRCESSGYESFPRDSECSSIDSSQDSEVHLHDPGGNPQVLSCWQWMFCGSGASPRDGWTAAGGDRDHHDPTT